MNDLTHKIEEQNMGYIGSLGYSLNDFVDTFASSITPVKNNSRLINKINESGLKIVNEISAKVGLSTQY